LAPTLHKRRCDYSPPRLQFVFLILLLLLPLLLLLRVAFAGSWWVHPAVGN
jgi:hypothetical protein